MSNNYDYLRQIRKIISLLKENGLFEDASLYENIISSSWTTSSEFLGEVMLLTQRIRVDEKLSSIIISEMDELVIAIKKIYK